MIELSLGIIIGIIITNIVSSIYTADLLSEIDKLKRIIKEAISYIEKYKQIYDIDGTIENQLDEFDVLASPKNLLEILEKGVNE